MREALTRSDDKTRAPGSSGAVGVSGWGVFSSNGGTGEAFEEFRLFTFFTKISPRMDADKHRWGKDDGSEGVWRPGARVQRLTEKFGDRKIDMLRDGFYPGTSGYIRVHPGKKQKNYE